MVLDGLLKRLDLFQRSAGCGRTVPGAYCHLVHETAV